MPALEIVIANKNYSSWSLRPWMAMSMASIPFTERMIHFGEPRFSEEVRKISPAGRVPILIDGDLTIWDSLAILEYLAETFPEKQLWPASREARAMARSVSNEMHSGFSALRNACPMNLRRPSRPIAMSSSVHADVDRIEDIFQSCRLKFGADGPFLFGAFSIADAMFTPVVTRFDTYAIPTRPHTRDYMNTIMATPAFRLWKADASKETQIVPHDEVD
jgi:glutathione S-transferase